jgi:NAD-dependent DNA ligase
MDALQADAFAIPDDSFDHVANALVNMQVTAPAAATVPASTFVDLADRSAAAAAHYDHSCPCLSAAKWAQFHHSVPQFLDAT